MDSLPSGTDPDLRPNELASLFDAPAFIRRARGVGEGLDTLLATCRRWREERLLMPRLRLGRLHALAGSWDRLLPCLASADQIEAFNALDALLRPRLRLPPPPTTSLPLLSRALGQLIESATRFNEHWRTFVGRLDLGPVNRLRDGYNRYYVIEKACSLRSDLLARHGFVPLPPLDADEVLRHLPLLPLPRLRTG